MDTFFFFLNCGLTKKSFGGVKCQIAGIAQPAQDTISDNETQEHNFYQLTLNFKKYIITVPQQQIQ